MDELLRLRCTVHIDHIDADVLHLLIHHPRHDTHHHDGEYEDNLRHERVAPNLQEFLLKQILYHSRVLNFLSETTSSMAVMPMRTDTSGSTSWKPTPIIISLRMAWI